MSNRQGSHKHLYEHNFSRREVATVETGSRLHAGLFSDHRPQGKLYQGFGLMIDEPGFVISACLSPSSNQQVSCTHEVLRQQSPEAPKNEDLKNIVSRVQNCLDRLSCDIPENQRIPLSLTIQKIIPQHQGLGSGTQLACAVGALWNHFHSQIPRQIHSQNQTHEQLAWKLGRGQRSCIGTYGFALGGLLIDQGIDGSSRTGELRFSTSLPESWRIILASPVGVTGLAGDTEKMAFQRLPPVSEQALEQMLELLDRLEVSHQNFHEFSAILREFGLKAGEAFSPVQGGRFFHPRCEQLFSEMSRLGIQGVAQSSWGPTMFGLCQNEEQAKHLERELKQISQTKIQISRIKNQGASLATHFEDRFENDLDHKLGHKQEIEHEEKSGQKPPEQKHSDGPFCEDARRGVNQP